MSARMFFAGVLAAGTFVIAGSNARSLFAGAEPDAEPPMTASASDQDQTTTLDDQSEVSLTVYNSDIALVRDVRNLQLARATCASWTSPQP
jgi:hypothetical protein